MACYLEQDYAASDTGWLWIYTYAKTSIHFEAGMASKGILVR
jgi:hypothetical protein